MGKKGIRFGLSILLGLSLISVVAFSGTLDNIVRAGVIKVGTVVWSPATIKDPNTGELSGYMTDAMEWIATEMGVEVEWYEATWGTVVAGLQSGQYDLQVSGTFATIPRATAVMFTDPIIYCGYGAATYEGSDVDSWEEVDQKGVVVAVSHGTGDYQWAKLNLKNAKLDVYRTPVETMFQNIVTKQADVVLIDFSTLASLVEANPGTKLLTEEPYMYMAIAWAVRQGEYDLLNFMNTAITQLNVSGTMTGLVSKYTVPAGVALPVYPQEFLEAPED